MQHIDVDQQDKKVRDFVRALSENSDGTILEAGGRPVLKVVPVVEPVDPAKIRAAIRKRRGESRKLNAEWEAVDREIWDKVPPQEG